MNKEETTYKKLLLESLKREVEELKSVIESVREHPFMPIVYKGRLESLERKIRKLESETNGNTKERA